MAKIFRAQGSYSEDGRTVGFSGYLRVDAAADGTGPEDRVGMLLHGAVSSVHRGEYSIASLCEVYDWVGERVDPDRINRIDFDGGRRVRIGYEEKKSDTRRLWVLHIRTNDDRDFVSVYEDEATARHHMLRDILDEFERGNVGDLGGLTDHSLEFRSKRGDFRWSIEACPVLPAEELG